MIKVSPFYETPPISQHGRADLRSLLRSGSCPEDRKQHISDSDLYDAFLVLFCDFAIGWDAGAGFPIRKHAIIMTQDCLQCGKCCEKWGWDQKGIREDLIPWIEAGRSDILMHVLVRFSDGRYETAAGLLAGDLSRITRIYYWVDPDGKKRSSCPFYERREDNKVYCRIHDTKPAVCIGFAPWASVWHDYGLNCPACRDTSP